MDWLRLWHDMPNDPKWRTIARNCGEPVSLVIATYLHMLVDASRNVTRGHVTVTPEDLASALDVTEHQITIVLASMEGRVIDNGKLLGWDKRQPKREDSGNPETGAKSAAQRQKEKRERDRLALLNAETPSSVTQCHGVSRNVTTEEIRLEEIREEEKHTEPQTPETPVDNSDPVCVVLKNQGIQFLNPTDPEFTRLKSEGADIGLWTQAAMIAFDAANPRFDYVLGIVRKKLQDRTRPKAVVQPITTPGRQGPDPTLIKLAEDARKAAPMPADVRRELQRQKFEMARASANKKAH